MHFRFVISALIVIGALVGLISVASSRTAKAVTTVEQLAERTNPLENIRLGARVAEGKIDYKTEPEFLVSFDVHGMERQDRKISILYQGIMPDTLKSGRDVILEGDFNGEHFVASSLLTQCPSKYEPPKYDDQGEKDTQ